MGKNYLKILCFKRILIHYGKTKQFYSDIFGLVIQYPVLFARVLMNLPLPSHIFYHGPYGRYFGLHCPISHLSSPSSRCPNLSQFLHQEVAHPTYTVTLFCKYLRFFNKAYSLQALMLTC